MPPKLPVPQQITCTTSGPGRQATSDRAPSVGYVGEGAATTPGAAVGTPAPALPSAAPEPRIALAHRPGRRYEAETGAAGSTGRRRRGRPRRVRGQTGSASWDPW